MNILYAPHLKQLIGLRHAFFGRTGGVSTGIYASLNCGLSNGDDTVNVFENRSRVATKLKIKPEHLLSCQQVHSPDVVPVTETWGWQERPSADAMVTKESGIALGILTADCVPILLADAQARVIGAAHAGWRGALGGVIENTVAAMEKLGADRTNIIAALGPCIWQDSYEVDLEFPAPFLKESYDHAKYFRSAARSGHWMFNLPAYAESKLRAAGIQLIESSPADTCADEERFFSYRRNTLSGEKSVGSLLSGIMLM